MTVVCGVDLHHPRLLPADLNAHLCGDFCQSCCLLLHLDMSVGQKCLVISKVQVFQLCPRGPLYPVSCSLSDGLHYPVVGKQEQASTAVFILSSRILFNSFPGTDSSTIPPYLPQSLRSPFLGSFTIRPSLHSSGISFS